MQETYMLNEGPAFFVLQMNTRSYIGHHKHKKATTTAAMLSATESNTAATLAVTDDGMTPASVPCKATTISLAGLTSIRGGD
eukprot:4576130-Ditylum_brightwellii.AAC.1